MFKVRNTILSEDIATAKFACDVTRCKGACCVIGNAGAPVDADEIPVLWEAYDQLKEGLCTRAREVVEEEGLIQGEKGSFELNCIDQKECVFVTYTDDGVAQCAIQKAFYEGVFKWEKPISCHLFPVRLKRIVDFDYANFEYVPELCSAGCVKGKQTETWLSDFLKTPLIRRYGSHWYEEFTRACEEIRKKHQTERELL